MGKIRGTHSSPGFYSKITDLSYAAKTDGITTLGLVGETLKGAAFEPIKVSNWTEYNNKFGGTSAEKFKDSNYPKYELPYIAKSYLKASDQLYVCRVLGLSGYNAGPAWAIKAKKNGSSDEYVIAIIRSRGGYQKYSKEGTGCTATTKYDNLNFYCTNLVMTAYTNSSIYYDCDSAKTSGEATYTINALNYGKFTLRAYTDESAYTDYAVSLNAGDKDYIYNVLGSNPNEGNATIFVEEFYDYMLKNLIETKKVDTICYGNSGITKFNELSINAITDPVANLVNLQNDELKKKHVGQTFVCNKDAADKVNVYYTDNGSALTLGHIYKVAIKTNTDGTREYTYSAVTSNDSAKTELTVSKICNNSVNAVFVKAYNNYVFLNSNETELTTSTDMSDYHENYRCAITPWIVSELKGSKERIEIKKLFRFYTISDGNCANQQIKVSIANIKPDNGTFDVYIRDYYDSDTNVTILESYKNLTMVPGSNNYIGLKIGTVNGDYESKSSYVTVEIIENEMTQACVPAGFLGYPTRSYGELICPTFAYNKEYDTEIKPKKQYFGLSDLTGVDVDMLNYKGKNAYTENYQSGYTESFHMDSTLSVLSGETGTTIYLDNEEFKGKWVTVSPNNVTVEGKCPIISSEDDMIGTIYEDVKTRKFTVYPYGGFDGWDIYRKSRTNTDDYKATKYKGQITNGKGETFSKIIDSNLSLTGNCITSDFYAYLAGYLQFKNPEQYEINLLATPGIDYVNNELLLNEVIDIVEDRLDTFYVPTTPDKPWGASESLDEMYSSQEAADNLEDSDVNTYYAATYYPWVKYFDNDNNIYISLPLTKDVVRNMADTDNKRYPWIAPAGLERGKVECAKLHFSPKLEDRDNVYDERINPAMKFSDGVRIWGNKTMYICDDTNPMNRINTVRLVLYMRKLIIKSTLGLIFEPEDTTLKDEYESIIKPILNQIKKDRGITDYRLKISQTEEQMDLHEMSCNLFIKPTPTHEYMEMNFVVTPQGIDFDDINI